MNLGYDESRSRNSVSKKRAFLIGLPLFLGFLLLELMIVGVGLVVIDPAIILGAPHADTTVAESLEAAIGKTSTTDPNFSDTLRSIRLRETESDWLVLPDGSVRPVGHTTSALHYSVPNSAWQGVTSYLIRGTGRPVCQFVPLYREDQVFAVNVFSPSPTPVPQAAVSRGLLGSLFLFLGGALGALFITRLVMGRFDGALIRFRRSMQLYRTGTLGSEQNGSRGLSDLEQAFREMSKRMEQAREELETARDRALRAEQGRAEFLAEFSHALGTPMLVIQGWIGFLRDGLVSDSDERTEYLLKIEAELLRIENMVERLRLLAVWEGTEMDLNCTRMEMEQPVREVLELFVDKARAEGVSFDTESLRGFFVEADRYWTREIFQVFVENAFLHAEGLSRVTFEAVEREGRVWIEVRDDGPGAGLPFEGAVERFSPIASGTGLGLAMASKLIERHGGELTVESSEDGSSFGFSLPAG